MKKKDKKSEKEKTFDSAYATMVQNDFAFKKSQTNAVVTTDRGVEELRKFCEENKK